MKVRIPPQIATGFEDDLQSALEGWIYARAAAGRAYKVYEVQYLCIAVGAHTMRHGSKAVADLIRKSTIAGQSKINWEELQ